MCLRVILCLFLGLVGLCAVLIVGVTGCGGDEDDNGEQVIISDEWVGTWALETIDGKTLEQLLTEDEALSEGGIDPSKDEVDLSVVTNNWTFNADGTWAWDLVITGELKAEGLRATTTFKAMGTHSVSGSNCTILIEESDGTVTLFIGGAKALEDENDHFFKADIQNGTWLRAGDTLTLTDSYGGVIVFKKK
jgi:hypothetical protein